MGRACRKRPGKPHPGRKCRRQRRAWPRLALPCIVRAPRAQRLIAQSSGRPSPAASRPPSTHPPPTQIASSAAVLRPPGRPGQNSRSKGAGTGLRMSGRGGLSFSCSSPRQARALGGRDASKLDTPLPKSGQLQEAAAATASPNATGEQHVQSPSGGIGAILPRSGRTGIAREEMERKGRQGGRESLEKIGEISRGGWVGGWAQGRTDT